MKSPLSIIEAAESLADAILIFNIEEKLRLQALSDSDGCDDTCGFCKPGTICFFHFGARACWPRRIVE